MEEVGEKVIGGVEGLNIYRRLLRGYAFYVTSERIIGAKMRKRGLELLKYMLGWRGSVKRSLKPLEWRGKTVFVRELEGEEAAKLLSEIEKRKDFEVRKEEIREIALKKPGLLKPGYVAVKTIEGKEYKIGIVAGCKEEFNYIKELLHRFHPEKITEA